MDRVVSTTAVLLAGCGSYYMVRDPSNGNTYYTTDVDRAGNAGAVRFTDERTGKVVMLPQSEVKKIDEYQVWVRGPTCEVAGRCLSPSLWAPPTVAKRVT